ncbi:hypothetical protein ZYGR_0I03630 [Zygosaccharomyces rouxii]|uniref:Uncharacterized protein n=1 Tax=Zygosaccharomyces rouxii TaxID=4956 RepID=A0A1Q2ZX02_ZYGRO|nr:hypothetical protein ZYGR_0I03630 [Zygosaccharomyces rouxii]
MPSLPSVSELNSVVILLFPLLNLY